MAASPPATVTATATPREEEKTLQNELSLPILLADRIIKSAQESESSKQECSDLAKQVDRLSQMLRAAARLAVSTPSLYDRPFRRISSDITKNLDRALTLVRKCKHSGVLRQLFSITTTADFRKVSNLLESSIGDMKWLLSILESDGGGTYLSLPPIASNDPILAWVWSYISTVQMGQLKDRVDAANELASLARDHDRNKKIIVEEGGIMPLLKLLKEGASAEAQIASANALFNIATDRERVRFIAVAHGLPLIVGVLGDSSMKVQIALANLIALMSDLDHDAQEEFMTLNVTRPLISLLSRDLVVGLPSNQSEKSSIHAIVLMNIDLAHKDTRRNLYSGDGSSHSGSSLNRKGIEVETSEVKHKLKVSCAHALWKLSKGSVTICRKITETKGLICLAKLVEKEGGELQYNCVMTIVEITKVAESNPDLRRAAFKTSSPPAKCVLDQLLRVIEEESDPRLKIPAIMSIGCLARTFPARETRVMKPLVSQLGNKNADVATEAAISLGKFVCPDNFNHLDHSKAIIEFDGVPSLMRLIKAGDRAQVHGLILLCYLAVNAGNSTALEQQQVMNAIEGAARSVLAQHPELRDLFGSALHQLTLYQDGGHHPHRQPFGL